MRRSFDDYDFRLTAEEKRRASVLLVENDAGFRRDLRKALLSLGYGNVSEAVDHGLGIQKLSERRFSHVIFLAEETNLGSEAFVSELLRLDPESVPIASSGKPDIDCIFDLLAAGARGFLVKPASEEQLDLVVAIASRSEQIPEAVCRLERNTALVSMVSSSLDRVARALSQARGNHTAAQDIAGLMASFRRSVELARTFQAGGNPEFLSAVEDYLLAIGRGPASRLGRLRRRLQALRESYLEEEA